MRLGVCLIANIIRCVRCTAVRKSLVHRSAMVCSTAVRRLCSTAVHRLRSTAVRKLCSTAVRKLCSIAVRKLRSTAVRKLRSTAVRKLCSIAVRRLYSTAVRRLRCTAVRKLHITAVRRLYITAVRRLYSTAVRTRKPAAFSFTGVRPISATIDRLGCKHPICLLLRWHCSLLSWTLYHKYLKNIWYLIIFVFLFIISLL